MKKRCDTKGAVITFRLTERDKYAIELIARRDKKGISAVIEYAVAKAIESDTLSQRTTRPEVLDLNDGQSINVEMVSLSILEKLWSPETHKRLMLLAQYAPQLMSFEDSVMWCKIKDEPAFWVDGVLDNKLLKAAWSLLENCDDEV